MTTPKPASAPPADAWREAVIDACVIACIDWDENNPVGTLRRLIAWENEMALDPAISERAAALAASAQVREVERRCPYCAGRIYTDAGCQNCKVGTTYPKPAPEPVPVAQEIERFDEMTDCGIQPNTNGRFVRHADHARIVAELEAELGRRTSEVIVVGATALACSPAVKEMFDMLREKAEALEASLAACRETKPPTN